MAGFARYSTRTPPPPVPIPIPTTVEALTYLYDLGRLHLFRDSVYTYFVRARSIKVPDPDNPGMEINLMSPPSATASVDVRADPLVPLAIPHVTVRADQGDGNFKDGHRLLGPQSRPTRFRAW